MGGPAAPRTPLHCPGFAGAGSKYPPNTYSPPAPHKKGGAKQRIVVVALGKEELEVETDQIIPVNVVGSWDLTSVQRQRDESATGVFVLDNWEIVEGFFRSMYCQRI